MMTEEALRLLLGRLSKPTTDLIDLQNGHQGVMVPDGYSLNQIAPLERQLTHVQERAVLHDRQSFIDYVNDYKIGATRIFAEPGFLSELTPPRARVMAVMDYHLKSMPIPSPDGSLESGGIAVGMPGFTDHIALYEPRYSEPWGRWALTTSKELSQTDFAEVLEECRADIKEPFAATLLDLVTTFRATKKVEFDSLTYQSDGSAKLHYSEEVNKSGSTAMPEKLTLAIPVYYRGQVFEVDVLIRYRVGVGGVRFQLKIDRPDRIEEEAFKVLMDDVVSKTNVPTHNGRLPTSRLYPTAPSPVRADTQRR